MRMAITERQRHQFFTRAEEVFGTDEAETLMSMLPPVGWADVATKQDLDDKLARLEAEIRATLYQELRRQELRFLSAMTLLLGIYTAVGQLLG
jgi:hypothetical protein